MLAVIDRPGKLPSGLHPRAEDFRSVRSVVAAVDALSGEVNEQVCAVEEVGDGRGVAPPGIRTAASDGGDGVTVCPEGRAQVLSDEAGCPCDHDLLVHSDPPSCRTS